MANKSIDDILITAAKNNGVDPDIIRAMAKVESSYNPDAISGAGAIGLMQLMPSTAASIAGMSNSAQFRKMLKDPEFNADIGCKYFASLINNRAYGNNAILAITAYHYGPMGKIISNHIKKNPTDVTLDDIRKVPVGAESGWGPESINYPASVNKKLIDITGSKKSLGNSYSVKNMSTGSPTSNYGSVVTSVNIVGPTTQIPKTAINTSQPLFNNNIVDTISPPITIYSESNDPDYFKLGDVVLKVPPQSISIQEYNASYSYPTVRTKGSPKIKTGQEDLMINVECMFPRVVDINGYTDTDNKMWYGGLRSIIAHYYRIPFCPLENPTIRRVVFPNVDTLAAEGNNIGTQETNLEVKTPTVTDSTTVDKSVTNQFNLTKEPKKNQVESSKSKEKINKDKGITPPTPSSTNTKSQDLVIAVVLDTLTVSTVQGYPNALQASMVLRPFNYTPFSNDFAFVRSEDDVINQKNHTNEIWKGTETKNNPITSTYNISDCEVAKKYYKGLLSEFVASNITGDATNNVYPANELELLYPISNIKSGISLTYFYTTETRMNVLKRELELAKSELDNLGTLSTSVAGHIQTNQYTRILPWNVVKRAFMAYGAIVSYDSLKHSFKTRLGIENPDEILFDPLAESWVPRDTYIENKINELGLDRNKLTENFKLMIDDMLNSMTIDANTTKTIDLDGPGRLVTGITATFKNKVVPIRTEGQIYPCYQYMGRGDVQFTMNLQTTDEDFMGEIRELSAKTNYTQLLANSTQSVSDNTKVDTAALVEGEFFKLFGVNKVIITDVTYSTVDEHPGLYNIQISAVQADMDIKVYNALVGQQMVEASILEKTIAALMDRDHKTWSNTSKWETISDTISKLSRAWEKAVIAYEGEAKIKKLEHEMLKDYHERFGVKWETSGVKDYWYNVLKGIAGFWIYDIAIENAYWRSKYQESRFATDKLKDEGKYRIQMQEHVAIIKVRMADKSMKWVKELNNPEILKLVEKSNARVDTRYNTCYADMDLPPIGGDSVDIPPDFFYRREDIVTSDSINQCLAIINQTNATKLLQSINMNFKNIQDKLEMDDTGYGQKFLELYSKTIKTGEEMQELQRMMRVLGISANANMPSAVLNTIKTIQAAIGSKELDERIKNAMEKRKTYKKKLQGEGKSANEINREMDVLDVQINTLKNQKASYSLPNGVVLTDMDTIGKIGTAQWYGQSFSDLETLEVQQKALESRKSDRTLQMARAFPTIKLYFIEEDAAQWLLWDDFYSYSAIRSCDIVKSTQSTSDTAVLRVSNISNTLTNPLADYQTENWLKDNTEQEQFVDRLMLRVGCPIMIMMGYDNNVMRLPMVFLGAIVEMKPGEGEIQIIAQGWGAQLNTPTTGKDVRKDWWGWDKAHGDVATWALNQIPGLRHLGNKSVYAQSDDPIRSNPKDVLMSRIINSVFETDMGENNPRDDNVYFPYDVSLNPLSRITFDWQVDSGQTAWEVIQEILLWYPDWIATVLPYYPDPERIYDRRLTLYVGPMDGYYKWTDKYDIDWAWHQEAVKDGITVDIAAELLSPVWENGSELLRGFAGKYKVKYPASKGTMYKDDKLLKCFKPVIDYHFYDSDHHIMDNSITATVDNMYNRVILSYPGGLFSEPIKSSQTNKFDATYEMSIDDDIKEDYIRSYVSYQKNIDTNWWVDCIEPMILGRMKTRKEYETAVDFDGREIVTEEAGNYLAGIPQYIRVANTILNNQCREMYNGSITVIGDPTVKPWDYCYIYDYQNMMNGPVQVKEVVHRFNAETGYTTTITPMLISHCQNFQATLDTNYLGYTWIFGALRGLFNKTHLEVGGGYLGIKAGKWGIQELAKASWTGGVLAKGIPAAAGRLGLRAIPYVGWGLLAYDIYDTAKHIGLTFQKEFGRLMGRQPITITPISYAGRPLLAGVEGMRTDDMWVHTIDAVTSIEDIPRAWVVSKFKKD